MIFGVLYPAKIWHQQLVQLPTSPVYCSQFTLANPKKVIFNSIVHTYAYFRLLRAYVISEEKKLLPPYPPHLKNVTTLPCKMHNFFIWLKVCCIRPNVGGSEKKTGCDVWQMECQASNVTANVQSDHFLYGYMLPVFFTTDQLHRPPRSAEIQPMSQQDAYATRPYRGLMVLDTREKWKRWKICAFYKKMKKMKNVCILQVSAVTLFICGGQGTNSLFPSAIT